MEGSHSQAIKNNKIKSKNNKANKREALYKRLELKLEIHQRLIRDQHKKFLSSHPTGEMTRDEFVSFLSCEKNIKPYVAKSLFRVFDGDGSNTIDFEEFMLASNFKSSSPEDKLDWIFKVFDEDGGGSIDIDEIIKIVIGLFNMNGEIKDKEEILAAVIEIIDIIDEDGNGEITKEEFVNNAMKSGFVRNLMEFFNEDEEEIIKEIKEKPLEENRPDENDDENDDEDENDDDLE